MAFREAPCFLFLALVAGVLLPAAGERLHIGSCVISVHTRELQRLFQEMRESAVQEDTHVGVRLLKKHTMKNVELEESCCFLRHLLRLYVERVFSSYAANQSLFRKNTSNLANSFLSIKRDLRQCHAQMQCHCREETRMKIEAIQGNFEKLDLSAAAMKAIGELGSLLEWLESFSPSKKHEEIE